MPANQYIVGGAEVELIFSCGCRFSVKMLDPGQPVEKNVAVCDLHKSTITSYGGKLCLVDKEGAERKGIRFGGDL